MKLSDKEYWLMDATLKRVYNKLWETEKEKLHRRLRSFPPANYPDILLSPRSMWHSSFLVLPSFHKSWDEISIKGGRL
jgi:hypothetical protein